MVKPHIKIIGLEYLILDGILYTFLTSGKTSFQDLSNIFFAFYYNYANFHI